MQIANEVVHDFFAFMDPAELGKMATFSDKTDSWVDMHFVTRSFALGDMEIRFSPEHQCPWLLKAENYTRAEQQGKQIGFSPSMSRKLFPLACRAPITGDRILIRQQFTYDGEQLRQPPRYVQGFKRIIILYLDTNVVAFLRFIRVLFNNGITVKWCHNYESEQFWNGILFDVWNVLKDDIFKLDPFWFSRMWQHRPLVLQDCPKLYSIRIRNSFCDWTGLDQATESYWQALSLWLHTPRADGRTKVLEIGVEKENVSMMENFKKKFYASTTRVNYIIVIRPRLSVLSTVDTFGVAPFVELNGQTEEKLELRECHQQQVKDKKKEVKVFWLVVRAPIILKKEQEQKWKQWEDEAVSENEWKVVAVDVTNESQNSGLSTVASTSKCKRVM
uniref:F-box domain-containing protein n=1 Tax=Globodera pallida TaxID=36090 RepID=A0A183BN89_GLOPA